MYQEDKKTGETILPVTNYDLFTLISRIYHFLILARQRELSAQNVSPQQLLVLQTIQSLAEKATQVQIAKNVERKPDVISRQLATMQKDGLITKTQYKKSLML
jgi:DNA-binding MarR family transcriptional regulator